MDANIKKAIAILLGMELAEIDVDSLLGKRKRRREANEIRDRKAPERFVDSWTNTMFKRQFRLSRRTVDELLSKIEEKYPILPLSLRMAG